MHKTSNSRPRDQEFGLTRIRIPKPNSRSLKRLICSVKTSQLFVLLFGFCVGYSLMFRTAMQQLMSRRYVFPQDRSDVTIYNFKQPVEKQVMLIAVMTSRKFLQTRALDIHETWGSRVPGSILYFVGGAEAYTGDLPLVTINKINDTVYPPQHKSFTMIKFIAETLADHYEWFLRSDDDIYIRTDKLELFLRGLDSSKAWYIGQHGYGIWYERGKLGLVKPYCMGGVGITFSRSVLVDVGKNLMTDCLNNTVSPHEDTELGRCVYKYTGLSCTTSREISSIFVQRKGRYTTYDMNFGQLEKGAITLHPIKDHPHMQRIDSLYSDHKVRQLQQKMTNLQREISDLDETLKTKMVAMKTTVGPAIGVEFVEPDVVTSNGEYVLESDVSATNGEDVLESDVSATNDEDVLASDVSTTNDEDVLDSDVSTTNDEDVLESDVSTINDEDVLASDVSTTNDEDGLESDVRTTNDEDGLESDVSTTNDEDVLASDVRTTNDEDVLSSDVSTTNDEDEVFESFSESHSIVKRSFKSSKSSLKSGTKIEDLPKFIDKEIGYEWDYLDRHQSLITQRSGYHRHLMNIFTWIFISKIAIEFEIKYGSKLEKSSMFVYSRLKSGKDMEYILQHKDANNTKRLIKTTQKFSGIQFRELLPLPDPETWIILPLLGRPREYRRFLEMLVRAVEKNGKLINLKVVLYEDGEGQFRLTQKISNHFRNSSKNLSIQTILIKGTFSRGRALTKGTDQLPLNSLLIFMDVDMYFDEHFLHRAVLNTIRGKQVWFPICFSQFNPIIACYGKDHCLMENNHGGDFGLWREFGFGIASMYKQDLIKVGGYDLKIEGWGGEDVDLYEKCFQSPNLQVLRTVDPSLIHIYHEKSCNRKELGQNIQSCLNSKFAVYGSMASLANILIDL